MTKPFLDDPKVRDALKLANLRTKIFASASILWERVLSNTEREQLGGDLEASFRQYGTLGMWMKLRGGSRYTALLEVARKLNSISDLDYHWLMREIGETPNTGEPDRPHWNHIKGKLYFRNKVIRSVRITKVPTNIQIVLDAFQAANWTPKISNPLTHGQQQLHETLRALKRKLKQIRFHSLEGGKAIRWEPTTQ